MTARRSTDRTTSRRGLLAAIAAVAAGTGGALWSCVPSSAADAPPPPGSRPVAVKALPQPRPREVALPIEPAPLPPLPKSARLVLAEDWAAGAIDPAVWYLPRKQWADRQNHGVTADNVRVERDAVIGPGLDGREKPVLVCQANGDRYDGPVVGKGGEKARVGGMAVSKAFFASGRFEVVMKIGSGHPHPGGPADPARPKGTVPAIWTYAYRAVRVPREKRDQFVAEQPMYNPLLQHGDRGVNEYWSELDFPEFGRFGDFDRGLYNTFLQTRHEPKVYDVSAAADGRYHTLTTEWRTALRPIDGVADAQVVEHGGYWWVRDKAVPLAKCDGNPLKRLGADRYAVYAGDRVDHWIDGQRVAENTKFVPSMAAQLTMGIWLPDWAGPADWQTATVSFASAKVWQYDDPGDVRGVLTEDLPNTFDRDGRPVQR